MMDSKTLVLEVLRSLGQREASELRQAAGTMTGTEIIAVERAVPVWSAQQDYTDWPVGAPVADEGQVWLLIQPHNAANYQGRPATLRALWGLAHTTDPRPCQAVGGPAGYQRHVYGWRVLPGR